MAEHIIKELGDKLVNHIPLLPNVKLMNADLLTLYINNTWRPYMTITGIDGIPNKNSAPNTLGRSISLRLSI